MPGKKNIDWERGDKLILANVLSQREIARQLRCAEGSVRNRVKALRKAGKYRDLSEQVKETARTRTLRESLRTADVSDEQVIEEAAAVLVEVVKGHRRAIKQGNMIADTLFAHLQEAATLRSQIEADIEIETNDDKTTVRRNQMMKAVSLPGHAGVLRDLSVAMKNFIPLERQAFSLDDKGGATEKPEVTISESDADCL